jgi:hypothetical protein
LRFNLTSIEYIAKVHKTATVGKVILAPSIIAPRSTGMIYLAGNPKAQAVGRIARVWQQVDSNRMTGPMYKAGQKAD